ncbi:MAG: GAF domain-containing protein, partial [Robiginitomaculum sp.]|nr:GAF domain-containing protein [Robiginitomaculum sp.]
MSESRVETYTRIAKEISAVIDGESSMIARYATVSCLLSEAFDHFFWTGFYLVDEHDKTQLVIGPYQGSLGCLRIPFGKGVCGYVAATKTTLLVD